jgi:hypothetical protein
LFFIQSCVIEYHEDEIETGGEGALDVGIMKKETNKTRKQRHSTSGKTAKPACGTLSYIAECRGAQQKSDSIRWAAPPDSSDKMVKK